MNLLELTESEKTAIVSLLINEIYNCKYIENSKVISLELERIIEKLERSS